MNGARKFGLVLFGAIFVVVFAGIAIANGGVTQPKVPSGDVALVQDVPDSVGDISQDDYDRTFDQTWKRGGLKAAPKPGDAQYQQVKEAALNDLLDQAWLTGEADELGVTATEREVQNEFASIRKDQFADDAAYQKFLKDSGFTEDEVLARVKLQVLSRKIEDSITKSVTTVPEDEVQDYYDSAKDTFATPESRDIKLIVTDNQADADTAVAALDKDDSDKSFAALAKKYSTHGSKSQGGDTVATEGAFPDPAGSDIMSADTGSIEGPVKTGEEYYVFRVDKVTPKKQQSFDEVKGQIQQQLLPTKQQKAMSDFVAEYNDKWTARTFCAEDYLIARCHNFESDGSIDTADPACYKEDAGDPKKPLSCPTPIAINAPMAPGGNVAAAAAATTQAPAALPQGPVPAGDAEDAAAAAAAAAAAGGATGAVPAGAAGATDPAAAAAAAQAAAAQAGGAGAAGGDPAAAAAAAQAAAAQAAAAGGASE